jgi:hypothetical protein
MPVLGFPPQDYLSCEEIIDTSEGAPFISGGTRTYTRRWHVIVARKEMGAAAVCAHPLLPRPYSMYQGFGGLEFDELAVLVSYRAKRKDADDFFHWIVEATYSTEVPEGGVPVLTGLGNDPIGSQNNPWDERPVVQWDWEETNESPPRDLDGKAFVTSSSMPFVPAPSFPVARQVLVVTRNEASYSREIAARYAYAVNDDTFLGALPETVKSMPVRMKVMNRGRLQYYQVTYRLVFNRPIMDGRIPKVLTRLGIDVPLQSWQPEILDQATHQLQTFVGVPFKDRPVPIIRYGSPVNHPVLLDGAGREQRPNAEGEIVPVFLKFRQFRREKFKPIIERGIFGGI